MDKSVHPLEPPLGALLPTPVTLDTYSLVMLVGLVKLMECGAIVQSVYVSSFRQHYELVIHSLSL